jgi:hypothetical protein
MAIVQISRIQQRRGLQQDLPQLAGGELGWSIDTRRLYIGNGTFTEGAPIEGITEILTSQSNFFDFINTYTFKGTDAGYTSVTGVSRLSPTLRSLQAKLDENISVKDFGATGNGVTDDTAAIQRALNQIYVDGLSATVPSLRRTVKIPAGTYFISAPILVPPGCVLIGDGKTNTILSSTVGTVFYTTDTKYQTGPSLGFNSATLPQYVSVTQMQFLKTAGTIDPVAVIDSCVNISFEEVFFKGDSSVANLVLMRNSVTACNAITFDRCVFNGGLNGIAALDANQVTNIKVLNSQFINQTVAGIVSNTNILNLLSEGNDFGNVNPYSSFVGSNYSIGNNTAIGSAYPLTPGLQTGSAVYGAGWTKALTANVNPVTTLTLGSSGVIDYQLSNSTDYRFGTVKYSSDANGAHLFFSDEYAESVTDFLNANLFANANGTVTCFVSAPATLKYNIKSFV